VLWHLRTRAGFEVFRSIGDSGYQHYLNIATLIYLLNNIGVEMHNL